MPFRSEYSLGLQSHRDEYKKTIGAHPSYDNANGLFAQVSVHIGFSAEHHSKCLKICLTEHPEVNFEVSCSDSSKDLRNAMLRYQRGDEGGAPDAELKYMEQHLKARQEEAGSGLEGSLPPRREGLLPLRGVPDPAARSDLLDVQSARPFAESYQEGSRGATPFDRALRPEQEAAGRSERHRR